MKRGVLSRLFGRGEGKFEAATPWQATTAQPIAAPQAVIRPPAQHDSAMTRWVRLPLAQAVVCGFFAAWLPTGITVVIIILTKAGGWWLAMIPATFVFSIMALSGVAWYVLFVLDRKTLMFIERFVGIDLNRDGVVGKPTPKPDVVRVERVDRENRSIRYDDLPVDTETLREIAHAILELRCNVSKRGLAKHTSLSVEKAAELLAAMREAEFARFNRKDTPESGTTLTKDGLDLLEEVL